MRGMPQHAAATDSLIEGIPNHLICLCFIGSFYYSNPHPYADYVAAQELPSHESVCVCVCVCVCVSVH